MADEKETKKPETEAQQPEDAKTENAPEEAAAPEAKAGETKAADGKDDKKKKKKDLKDALAQKEAELAEQKDQHLRLMAEYQNYRNRTTEEKKKIYGDAKVDCVKELLNVMDTFERALEPSICKPLNRKFFYARRELLQNTYDVSPFALDERVQSPKEFRKCTDSFFVSNMFHKGIAISQPIVTHWFG